VEIELSQLDARRAVDLGMVETIVKHAQLEWFEADIQARKLPPMAVRPEHAANLRASLRTR
jgi:hypothetical protein